MRRIIAFGAVLVAGFLQTRAIAQINATVTYTSQQLGPSSYQYSITLHNTGTTQIGTFWFGWIPGYDFLPSNASNVSSPTGWAGGSIHEAIGSYAIEWYDTGSPLAAGQTLSGFSITTADSPSTLVGPSLLGMAYPVNTSWVYMGELQSGLNASDQGTQVMATAVPEPTSLFLLAPAMLLVIRRTRR
jgi:hypothetical protein